MVKKRILPKKRTKGKGIVSWIKKKATQVKDYVTHRFHLEPRRGMTARFADFMRREGHNIVMSLRIGRKEVAPAVQAFLNTISLGEFKKMMHTLHYDTLWHNYLILSLSDGRTFRLEKNHVVQADPAKRSDGEFDIPLNGRHLTLNHVIEVASKGDEDFFLYHPQSNNCQIFTNNILTRNHLTTHEPAAQSYLQAQNGEKLLSTLPGILNKLPKFITDVAGVGDRIVHGDGISRRRKAAVKT